MSTENKNFVESVLEAQQKLVDNVIENTKKATNNNTFVNDSMEKGKDFYKNWLEQQKKNFASTSEKVEQATASTKENFEKAGSYYQNWLNNQVEMAKKTWETNQNFFKNNTANAENLNKFNPMEMFNNFNNFYQQYNNATQWANIMTAFNPMTAFNQMKGQQDQMSNMFNQYNDLIKQSFSQLGNNLQQANSKDAFSNMMNVSAGFNKFYEMWTPFWKSIQDKSFNAEAFKKQFNFDAYKDLMNNYFGFNTDDSRQYFQQTSDLFQGYFKDAAGQGRQAYQQMQDTMNGMNPFAGQNFFEQTNQLYTNFQQTFANAISPIAKLATPSPMSKSAADWSALMDKAAIYNIKNAEMQYMVYQQGQKVMEALADNVVSKIENGVEINNVTGLYQEWLNIGDKVYVELFESDSYSQLMAEVSALQLKLRKDYDMQMEKSLRNFPVATKSELDELYKTIYDLKKEVRDLERRLNTQDEQAETKVVTPINNYTPEEPTPSAAATTAQNKKITTKK